MSLFRYLLGALDTLINSGRVIRGKTKIAGGSGAGQCAAAVCSGTDLKKFRDVGKASLTNCSNTFPGYFGNDAASLQQILEAVSAL